MPSELQMQRLGTVARALETLRPRDEAENEVSYASELLERPQDASPIQILSMDNWYGLTECGTTGCIAGVTVLCYPDEARQILDTEERAGVDDIARSLLGLSDEAAAELFWMTTVRAMRRGTNGPVRPHEAAEAVRRVAKGVDSAAIWNHLGQAEAAGDAGDAGGGPEEEAWGPALTGPAQAPERNSRAARASAPEPISTPRPPSRSSSGRSAPPAPCRRRRPDRRWPTCCRPRRKRTSNPR